jgi:hypothetical protein
LLQEVRRQATEQLQQAAALPANVCFHFDIAQETSEYVGSRVAMAAHGGVQKTARRTVVSLVHGRFQACESVRLSSQGGQATSGHSARLAEVVPCGARYAFDVIAHVGIETYVHGHSLQEVREDLAHRQPAIEIPSSTLWDLQQKFLFYLGGLHAQAVPQLRRYLAEQPLVCWLLDGTVEPGTPVFLGIREAASGLFLFGRKIVSEKLDDIRPCLQNAATCYGLPDRVLHDLNAAMSGACEAALPETPHYVCHYHLARDVGEDLYAKPQAALLQRQQQLKLLARLREQRRGQNDWLRQRIDSPAQLMLRSLLADEPVDLPLDDTLGREVLLAFHYWILDYRSDGRRRGFPFDPYTLYLHRRLAHASEILDRLLAHAGMARRAPQVLLNFQQYLRQYRGDAKICAAAAEYERCAAMFVRLRDALRLSAESMDHLHHVCALPTSERQKLRTALAALRSELRQQSEDPDHADRPLAQLVLRHLDKYWLHLVPGQVPDEGEHWERTTNQLESQWGGLKRGRRLTHGRGKLTRDFQALPAEYLLVPNLENPTYLELVLGGSLENLPSKLAAASRKLGSFDAWRRLQRPRPIGQIPRPQLREAGFLDNVVHACHHHCQTTLSNVA